MAGWLASRRTICFLCTALLQNSSDHALTHVHDPFSRSPSPPLPASVVVVVVYDDHRTRSATCASCTSSLATPL
jgi:hypothetical protein